MKFATLITFSNGTTRAITWSNGREWKAEAGKEAEYCSFEVCWSRAQSFGLLAFNPKVICCPDDAQFINSTLEDEEFDELERYMHLAKEITERNDKKKEA